MNQPPNNYAEAVQRYIATLDDAERAQIRECLPVNFAYRANNFTAKISSLFDLPSGPPELRTEIEQLFGYRKMFFEYDVDQYPGLFEALMVLEGAQKELAKE